MRETRQLYGKENKATNKKGHVDWAIAKFDVVTFLLNEARERGVAPTLISKMEVWSEGAHKYIADMGVWDAEKHCFSQDRGWLAALPGSAQLLADLWEAVVLGEKYDPAIKSAKIQDISMAEGFLEKGAFAEACSAIWRELENESAGKPQLPDTGVLKLDAVHPAPCAEQSPVMGAAKQNCIRNATSFQDSR